jgi:hypothetical protein
VVFHVEAASRGLRRTPLTGNHRRGERRAALYTLLANCSAAALPFLAVRLFFGSLLRALGLLLVRAPREALDELAALATTYLRPDRILAGRVARRRTGKVSAREVRHLLAPFWLPYRHGLDFVSDLAMAVVNTASDASTARRGSRVAGAETGPVAEEAQNLPDDTGFLARLLSSPTAGFFAALVLLALIGARGLVGSGYLSGGSLLPAPGSAATWWGLYLESWHDIGVGSDVPAAPYVAPLAMAGTLLLDNAWLVVDLLFLFSVPLAAFGALVFLRTLTRSSWMPLWGAAAYALFPVLSGAVAQGRLGTVAAAVVLPWVAHAALHLRLSEDRDRRWRAAWRTALLLAILTAFVPLAWPLALVVAGSVVVTGLFRDRPAWSPSRAWGPVAVAVGTVPVLLLPWSGQRLMGLHQWYAEAGLPSSDLVADLGAWELLGGRAATSDLGAAPVWFSIGIAVAAVASLVRKNTRPTVLATWFVGLVALAAVVALDAGGYWAGFPVLVLQAAAVTAVTVAGTGITAQLSGSSFGWRQPVGLLVVVGALLAPVAGALWWAAIGVDGPLDRAPAHRIPAYMTEAVLRDPDQGILVVRSEGDGLGYTLMRGNGARVGDDSVAVEGGAQDDLTELVADLATAPTPDHVTQLSSYAVEFIYLPPPGDPDLAGDLDSVSGLTSASAARPAARAWQLDRDPTRDALPAPDASMRPLLLVLQGVAVVAAIVLAAPSRRVRR